MSSPTSSNTTPSSSETRQQKEFLESGKQSASAAFKLMEAMHPGFGALSPDKVFEVAFCMGSAHGVESMARVAEGYFKVDQPKLSHEEHAGLISAGNYFAKLFRSLVMQPKQNNTPT